MRFSFREWHRRNQILRMKHRFIIFGLGVFQNGSSDVVWAQAFRKSHMMVAIDCLEKAHVSHHREMIRLEYVINTHDQAVPEFH